MSDREVTRCRKCHLNQFMTQSGMCRKCRHSLAPEPIPDVQPVSVEPARKLGIAFVVKLLRDANGLSQLQLAQKMGCTNTYISKIENRHSIPGVKSIAIFAAALDATPYTLITIAETMCAA